MFFFSFFFYRYIVGHVAMFWRYGDIFLLVVSPSVYMYSAMRYCKSYGAAMFLPQVSWWSDRQVSNLRTCRKAAYSWLTFQCPFSSITITRVLCSLPSYRILEKTHFSPHLREQSGWQWRKRMGFSWMLLQVSRCPACICENKALSSYLKKKLQYPIPLNSLATVKKNV